MGSCTMNTLLIVYLIVFTAWVFLFTRRVINDKSAALNPYRINDPTQGYYVVKDNIALMYMLDLDIQYKYRNPYLNGNKFIYSNPVCLTVAVL